MKATGLSFVAVRWSFLIGKPRLDLHERHLIQSLTHKEERG